MGIWEEFRLKQGASKVQKAFDEKIELTRKHVSLVFHRFLNDENPKNRLSIYFNGEAVKGIDPFLTKHPATQPLSEQVLRMSCLISASCPSRTLLRLAEQKTCASSRDSTYTETSV